jgi:hypothetical protein
MHGGSTNWPFSQDFLEIFSLIFAITSSIGVGLILAMKLFKIFDKTNVMIYNTCIILAEYHLNQVCTFSVTLTSFEPICRTDISVNSALRVSMSVAETEDEAQLHGTSLHVVLLSQSEI